MAYLFFPTNTTYTVTQYLQNVKVFMIGGGASGTGSFLGGGGAGYITTATYPGNLSPGHQITVTIGAGGAAIAAKSQSSNAGGTTTVDIAGTSYTAEGGGGGYTTGGNGSSGGGGAGNPGYGGSGGSGGSNGFAGTTYPGGTGMGTTAFTAAINFMSGYNIYNIREGALGMPPNVQYAGGGGAGGVITTNAGEYPSTYGGQGYGAGGTSGGLYWPSGFPEIFKIFYPGGAGSAGMAYVFADIIQPVSPSLTFNSMTTTYGNGAFGISQPSTNSGGSFSYSVIGGNSVSISGTTVTISGVGTTNIRASQAASGNFLSGYIDGTITVYQATPTLTVSKNKYITKYISNDNINFDVFSTNGESGYTRQFSSNNGAMITVPNASSPNVRIVGPGRTTVNVTQYGTTNYATVTIYNIIEFVIVGQNQPYTSEDMTSLDLSGTNLSGSTLSNCNLTSANLTNANLTNSVFSGSTNLTSANLYNATVNSSTNLSSSTITSIKSGRITGVTTLLPSNYIMI